MGGGGTIGEREGDVSLGAHFSLCCRRVVGNWREVGKMGVVSNHGLVIFYKNFPFLQYSITSSLLGQPPHLSFSKMILSTARMTSSGAGSAFITIPPYPAASAPSIRGTSIQLRFRKTQMAVMHLLSILVPFIASLATSKISSANRAIHSTRSTIPS